MGRRPQNYTKPVFVSSSALSYEQLLSATKKYVKIYPVDTQKTIYLISKARGERSLREYSADAGHITFVQLYRILDGETIELSDRSIACLVYAAAPGSNVTLDALMEAQGRIRKDSLEEYDQKQKLTIKQIVVDTLLLNGYEIQLPSAISEEKTGSGNHKDFTLLSKKPGIKKLYTWSFEIISVPIQKKILDYTDVTNELLSKLVTNSIDAKKRNRHSFIFDNELVYQELKKKVVSIRIPNEASLILVSVPQRKVLEEFIVPITKKRPSELFILQSPNSSEALADYSVSELQTADCRAIIADGFVQKGYMIRYCESCIKLPQQSFIDLNPDFSFFMANKEERFVRSFFFKNTSYISGYSEISDSVHDWFVKSLACFSVGGCVGKLSIVVDKQDIYQAIIAELSTFKVSDNISVILTQSDKRVYIERTLKN